MIHVCRVCGKRAGGLVSEMRPMGPWPEIDLCPNCHETEEEKQVRESLEIARIETAVIRARERQGEHITADVMEMRLR